MRAVATLNSPTRVFGRERTPTPGCGSNWSHQRDTNHPQIHTSPPDAVSARAESPNYIPTEAMGLVGCHITPMCRAQSTLLAREGRHDGAEHPHPLPKPQLALSMHHYVMANVVSVDEEKLCAAKMEVNGSGTTFCSELTCPKHR